MAHRRPNAQVDVEIEVVPMDSVPPYTGAVWFGAWLVIDGRRFGGSFAFDKDDILEVPAFFASLRSPGIYPLFTCTCGDFGCGGCWTEVVHTDEVWVLRNAYDPLRDPSTDTLADMLEEEFEAVVPRTVVAGVAAKIAHALEQTRTRYPGRPILNGTIGTPLDDVRLPAVPEGPATQF